MDIFSLFHQRIAKLLEAEIASGGLPKGLDLSRFVVEPPREAAHGDLATNAAMVYAKEAAALKSSPRALAERLVEKLTADPMVAKASVAGPGFVNVSLHDSVLHEVVRLVIQEGEIFGSGVHDAASRVNVEYVSANPTGPMHIGHARGAAFGDALANLLAFSGRVTTREYYVNDAGAQVDVLARSTFLRYREALGEEVGDDPGRALSRRLFEAGGRRARALLRRVFAAEAGILLAADRAQNGDRSDDDDDPRRSRLAEDHL